MRTRQRELGASPGTRHLVDLPRGYHAPAGGQAWHDHVQAGDELPSGRRVIELRQVDEMALRPCGGRSRCTDDCHH
ncbi:MAG: hypothetical protein LC776_14875 [Acidobacteria bacterium]|nr:hypothetical protein [Acidobacteriota bacterium]